MNIVTVCIGKTDEKAIEELISKYEKRLPNHWNYQRVEIPDLKNRKILSEQQQKDKEAELMLSKLQNSDFVVLLDERGKNMSSVEFSKELQTIMNQSYKQIIFLIGGPYGFAEKVYQRANLKLSFSKMTFTHQMIRLFLTEQIYRAYTIQTGKPYHHE